MMEQIKSGQQGIHPLCIVGEDARNSFMRSTWQNYLFLSSATSEIARVGGHYTDSMGLAATSLT